MVVPLEIADRSTCSSESVHCDTGARRIHQAADGANVGRWDASRPAWQLWRQHEISGLTAKSRRPDTNRSRRRPREVGSEEASQSDKHAGLRGAKPYEEFPVLWPIRDLYLTFEAIVRKGYSNTGNTLAVSHNLIVACGACVPNLHCSAL